MIRMIANGLTKEFNRKKLFENISFDVTQGTSLAITGRNGAGKSTLLKICCGILEPSRGTWELEVDSRSVKKEKIYESIGLVSPYLNLYDEFSGLENLQFIKRMRKSSNILEHKSGTLLELFGLYKHRNKEVRHYSSGMKQRLKYCAALLHDPKVLFLDEPQSNLDSEGIEVVRRIMKEQIDNGILIFATNDSEDLNYANQIVDLNSLNMG